MVLSLFCSILQNERKLYSARVILSVEAMTAAVQVWNRDKKMLTVAQTIGTNQIPLPTQVRTLTQIPLSTQVPTLTQITLPTQVRTLTQIPLPTQVPTLTQIPLPHKCVH